MGFDGVRFLVQVRKLAIRTVRTSYRSVRNHPFLVTALVIAVLLYRSSPFLFSLLVSASPVLVCTALLLGTLLSFGNPQIPQIEKEESVSSEVSSLRTESVQNSAHYFQKEAVVFGRDDLYTDTSRQVSAERGVEEAPLLDADGAAGKFRDSTLTPQNSQEIVFEQLSADEAKYENSEVEVKKENGDEAVAVEFEGVPSTYEVRGRGFEIDMSVEGSVDGHRDDHFESASVPWTRVNGDDNGDEDEDGGSDSDSGSDGAESSSPDPSMADIIPLLDELHPLIESEELVSGNLSRENSGLLSHTSHSSGESSIDSDGESDHKEEEEGAGDDDEEEENQGDKETAEKSAITWTEDDEKNLMDLGSSELERNQRLESLIARRRARRMMTERNLIDLDGFDLPFQVPMISTTRQNPFDFPNDAYDDMGLPPIPGSAPSVLLPRRNPFDIPYDSSEEKPDLMGDSFQQEFKELNQKEAVKEPVFRRHESFHMGSSFFDFPRQEGRGASRASRFRPYFIPERLASEETSYSSFMRQPSDISEESPSFQRQTSELSGTSSFHRQISGVSVSSSFQRQSSDLSDSKASSAAETEPLSVDVNPEEAKLSDHDSGEERIPDSGIDHASDHVEHGSQSSYSSDDQSERRDFDLSMHAVRLGESESHTGTEFHQAERGHIAEINLGANRIDPELDSWISESRNLAAAAGNIMGEGHLMSEPVDDSHYSSSSSSLSEEHNDVGGGLVIGEEIEFRLIEKHDAQDDKFSEASDFHHHLSGHTHSAERSTLETIEEEHISSPSSSLVSDEHKSTSLKLDEALVNMGQIMPDVDEAADAPNEQALVVSNNALTMDVEDIEDPVYDLSPQAGKNLLSVSSEHRLVDFTELENKDLKQENDDHLSKYEDDTDACVPMVYDDSLNLSAMEEMHSEAVSEHPSTAQADLSYVGTVSTKELNLVDEDALQSKEADSYEENIIDVPGKFKDNLVYVADEGDSVKDGFLIHPAPSDDEEVSSVTPEKLEEISNSDEVHSEDNAEMNHLSNLPLQTDATSINVPESGLEPAAVFDFGESAEERPEIEFQLPVAKDADGNFQIEGSVVPEDTIGDQIPDVEEALLSELDAVGDFLVTDVGMDMKQDTVGVEKSNASEVICTNDVEPEVEDVGTGMELNSHTPDSQTRLDVSEPEFNQDAERSGNVESLRFWDELHGKNIEGSLKDSEYVTADTELMQFDGNTSVPDRDRPIADSMKDSEYVTADNELMQFDGDASVLERDQRIADLCGPAPAMVEELESSDIAGIYTASDSHVSDGSKVIEKDETALVDKEVVDIDTRDTTEVESAETGLELKFHSLESKNKSDILESESSQGVKVSGAVEPFHLHDEIQSGESEDGSLEDSEYGGITRNELVTNDPEDKPAADVCGSALAMGEEMKSAGVAGIEKDETALGNKEAVDINTSNAREVENTETEMGLNSHTPENKIRFDVSESVSNQDNEESLLLQDEVQREETEGGSSEYAITADDPITKDGDVLEKDEPTVDTCGPTPSMEEEIESSGVVDTDTSSISQVLNNSNAAETDETGLGDKEVIEINTRDAMEVENPQADATMQFEAAQPVSPHVTAISPGPPSESAELQALQVEDHQIDQKHFPVEQLETSTAGISAVEKSDGQ